MSVWNTLFSCCLGEQKRTSYQIEIIIPKPFQEKNGELFMSYRPVTCKHYYISPSVVTM